jgi:ATP-dependent helicase/nuclease subunit A
MGKVIPIRPDDEAARQRIRNSLDESLIVEAAAGTGKTSELITRIVTALRTGKIATADNLVAVTFTRKAAGELKLRLRQELDRAVDQVRQNLRAGTPETRNSLLESRPADFRRPGIQGSKSKRHRQNSDCAGAPEPEIEPAFLTEPLLPNEQIQNLENAIAHLEEAHIGTIHSFCAEILRERPVEANVDPAFHELSDPESQRLYRRAFRRWSQEKLSASPPGLRRCLSRLAARSSSDDSSPLEEVERAGWGLIQWRDFGKAWEQRPFDRESAIDALVQDVLSLAELVATCPRPGDELVQALRPVRDLTTWIERAEAARGRKRNERDYDGLEGRLLILLGDLRKKMKIGRGKFAEGVTREQVLAARDSVVRSLENFKRDADAQLAALLQDEMRDLMAGYDEVKRKAGALDFVDLLIKVRELVRSNGEVRQHLQDKFTHIFVDEFQDTDPLQAEILLLLSADDPDDIDWLRVTPKTGKLFLVGDPKQSVYRFRRADMVLYQQLRDELETRGVPVVHLTKSFRALPSIQECINSAFAPMMVENRVTGQAGYVRLEPHREDTEDQPRIVALPVPSPYGQNDVTRWAIDKSLPQAVAAFASWLTNQSGWTVAEGDRPVPIKAKHLCILFRRFVSYRTDMTRDYLRELEAHDVPHLLVGGKSFHSREEIVTLRAALTAIEWPDDQLAVFATLKGSLFAIRDDVLLRFRDEFKTLHPFRSLPANLAADFKPVAEALDLLARLHRRRNWRPVVETVNELLEATRAHAGFALRPAGNQALANVYRVCDLARTFELTGGISFRGFVEDLAEQAEREESPEAPILEEGAEGVRIMTVHAAKGLEFPVVILADITAKLARQEPDMYVDAKANLCAMRLVGCSPWDLLDHEKEERERDLAEAVRVSYVAATRARDLLVVPAVGDGPYEGWLNPLNLAIYPPPERRRQAENSPRCPAFGSDSVVERPFECDEPPQSSVMPGLHRPQLGSHTVTWWDPAKLPKSKTTNFGIRQQEILSRDPGSEAVSESMLLYQDWQRHRALVLEEGKRPQFNLSVVTEAPELPESFEATIDLETVERSGKRPQGARFGSLVHAVLGDADLSGTAKRLAALAQVHGRVLGSSAEEIAAAIEAATAALNHSLLARARHAERCHREIPVLVKCEDGRMIEGTLDLAFLEQGTWNIVDFKTDAHLPRFKPQYIRQLQWYVYAMGRVTGAPARGWLLSV